MVLEASIWGTHGRLCCSSPRWFMSFWCLGRSQPGPGSCLSSEPSAPAQPYPCSETPDRCTASAETACAGAEPRCPVRLSEVCRKPRAGLHLPEFSTQSGESESQATTAKPGRVTPQCQRAPSTFVPSSLTTEHAPRNSLCGKGAEMWM